MSLRTQLVINACVIAVGASVLGMAEREHEIAQTKLYRKARIAKASFILDIAFSTLK